MKILHTADWHIGKLVHGISMIEEQEYILNQLIEIIKREKIDLIIIAGDIYDRAIAPTEAVELLNETLYTILEKLNTKIIIIAGNHDSPSRLDFASGILKNSNLYIIGNIKKDISPIDIEDEYGFIRFHPIPYADPLIVKKRYEVEESLDHDKAIELIIQNMIIDKDMRNICIHHGFVIGSNSLDESESERTLSVGGSGNINANHFSIFDYVALGHLHKPQRVKENIRYSGSLLKYSFSEYNHRKSITIIDFKEKGNLKIDSIELKPRRDLIKLKGNLEELINMPNINKDDYINITLTDKGKLYEPMEKLRKYYPNVLLLEKEEMISSDSDDDGINKDYKNKRPEELFKSFYKEVKEELEDEYLERALEEFKEIYEEVRREEREES